MTRTARSWFRTGQDYFFWLLCATALACLIVPPAWIIVGLLKDSAPLLSMKLLTENTAHLGLQNAIVGTFVLGLGVLLTAGPIGIGAGVFITEFGGSRPAAFVRFVSEVLAGVPSIVVGYAAYVLLVVQLHWGYSILAGIIALATIVTPYIVKTTEVSLRQVPTNLREGALALGLPMTTTLRRVLFPPALPGIITGLIVALAISTGETAPLLYTAGFSDANPVPSLTQHPVGYLTYIIFTDIQLPSIQAHQLANAAAAVTLLLLLVLIIGGRVLAIQSARQTARMAL